MVAAFLPYSELLSETKWISKFDFLSRLNNMNGNTSENHQRFLQFLSHLHFSFIRKDKSGEIQLH